MEILEDLTSFKKSAKRPLIVVLGPTASGKTALSLKIAHHIDAEIISTDSRQVYKEMEIGTDIIQPEQQEGIAHHMLGIRTPDQTLTTGEYKEIALQKIEEIYKRGHIPILVGGTGLYISSIIEGYDIPRIPPNEELRRQLQKELDEKGSAHIHEKLKKMDPKAAEKIHPNNIPYIIRAIEINIESGENKADKKNEFSSPFDLYMIGINWPREELYARVNLRVDLQLKRGLIEEVKTLMEKKYPENLPAMSSLGAKEIIPYINGEMTLEDCIEILKRNTRRYAKRQMTWFRRYDNVTWLNPSELEKIIN